MKKAASLYLHVPFCSRKCAYCDFAVRVLQSVAQVERYFEHLALEFVGVAETASPLQTLYLGEGPLLFYRFQRLMFYRTYLNSILIFLHYQRPENGPLKLILNMPIQKNF